MKEASNTKQTPDLTGYATLLGESFASKIDLLSQIIKDSHYPSIGRYKEKLLSKLLSDYIPRRFEVGTGFILFPKEQDPTKTENPDFDFHNQGTYVLSRQCDIIVFDANEFPVVYRDDDFVIVRPESVRTIIEVKGSITTSEVSSTLEGFFDLATKWNECKGFYEKQSQLKLHNPNLLVLGWDIYKDKSGRKNTNPARIRKQMVDFVKGNFPEDLRSSALLIVHFYLYNECVIDLTTFLLSGETRSRLRQGYSSHGGKFVRFRNGKPYQGGDSTIASLLASVHASLGTNFNRFISYAGETNNPDRYVSYKYSGHDYFFDKE